MALRHEKRRVTPSTFCDENGNWITTVAIDSSTLIPREATADEIKAAKNAKPEKDDGTAKPDSTTRVTGASLPPGSASSHNEIAKTVIEAINIEDARAKDEALRYEKFREQELRANDKPRKPAPDTPSL